MEGNSHSIISVHFDPEHRAKDQALEAENPGPGPMEGIGTFVPVLVEVSL